MTRPTTAYERLETDPAQRAELRKKELILAVTCAISAELERQGVNKAEFARRLGRTRAHVTQLLAGDSNLTLGSIAEMADALGCTAEINLTRGTAAGAKSINGPAHGGPGKP
jgi:hypothetical protein